jgi:hypothetical protein
MLIFLKKSFLLNLQFNQLIFLAWIPHCANQLWKFQVANISLCVFNVFQLFVILGKLLSFILSMWERILLIPFFLIHLVLFSDSLDQHHSLFSFLNTLPFINSSPFFNHIRFSEIVNRCWLLFFNDIIFAKILSLIYSFHIVLSCKIVIEFLIFHFNFHSHSILIKTEPFQMLIIVLPWKYLCFISFLKQFSFSDHWEIMFLMILVF